MVTEEGGEAHTIKLLQELLQRKAFKARRGKSELCAFECADWTDVFSRQAMGSFLCGLALAQNVGAFYNQENIGQNCPARS